MIIYEHYRNFGLINNKPTKMKLLFTCVLAVTGTAVFAQPAAVTQATITTKTTVIVPEGAEADGPRTTAMIQREGGGEAPQMVRFGGEGETTSKTYLKGGMVKTVVETEMGRTTTIRDNTAKKTTTLMEMMGNKNGFYATDEEQAEMRKRMDSMIQSRGASGLGGGGNANAHSVLAYTEESKKIAGYVCKKAFLVTTRGNGTVDSTVVWYNTEIQFEGLKYTGGPSTGFMGMPAQRTSAMEALEQLKGFPMAYEIAGRRGRKTVVEVTKIDTKKEIADKEFEVPKDFVVKPMKDMQAPGGGMQIRIGGPGGGQQ